MNKGEKICSWLHISDLHYEHDANQDRGLDELLKGLQSCQGDPSNPRDGGLSYILESNPVDVIVISGDVLKQGNREHLDHTKSCISEIYALCEKACNWKEGDIQNRLCFIPGNHDLNRKAFDLTKENELIIRENVVNNLSEDVFIPSTDPSYKLLTSVSFSDFFKLFCELTHREEETPCAEYRLFSFSARNNQLIIFCGINTALSAGRRKEKNDSESIEAAKPLVSVIDEYHRSNDAERRSALMEVFKRVKNDLYHWNTEDKGKLCFISEEAQAEIEQKISEYGNDAIIICFGHHPTTWLSEQAQNRLYTFMRKIRSHLYLCGHTHEPELDCSDVEPHPIGNKSLANIWQVQIGSFMGIAEDRELGGFSIGSIYRSEEQLFFEIKKWQYVNTSLGRAWVDASITKTLNINHRQRTSKKKKEDYESTDRKADSQNTDYKEA